MTSSPSNIRVLRPKFSTDSTARHLEEDAEHVLTSQPEKNTSHGNVDATNRREQLKVISGQIKSAPVGYSIFVLSIPVIALLIVLIVNIVVSNRQYDMVELSSQLTKITQSNEALAQQLSQKAAPQAVAQQASEMGMVLPGATASIDLASGKILGTATAAEADNVPTSFVAKPTVRSSTGIPTEVEVTETGATEPVVVTHGDVPDPESYTVKIVSPNIQLPQPDATNTTAEQGVASQVGTSSVGSLQGPKVSFPSGQ